MQTSWNVFLPRWLSDEYLPNPMSSADQQKLIRAFTTLDVTHNESTNALPQFRTYVQTSAPALAPLLNTVPVQLKEIESTLHQDEVLVSVLTTGDAVFVLAANSTTVSFHLAPVEPSRVEMLVHRLRGSLLPRVSGGKLSVAPFDAGAAFELYSVTLGLVSDVTRDKTHIFWHANGALASI